MMRTGIALVTALALGACSSSEKPKEPPAVDMSVAQYVLDEVPSDLPNPTLIDFEGKVQLIGWKLDAKEPVAAGQRFKVTFYWRSVAPLGPGWSLFTHLTAPGGARLDNPDDIGPLRKRASRNSPQTLGPGQWQPGKVYVDEQELEMPKNAQVPEVTVQVGVWKDWTPARLDVISGPADREQRAIVTHIKTGWVPPERTRHERARPRT
jgi:hypothetical protein